MLGRFAAFFLVISLIGCDPSNKVSAPLQESLEEGEPFPAVRLTTLDGKTITNHELKGKVVLINFFAIWCTPCVFEMQHLETHVWQKHRDQDFLMLGIGQNSSSDLSEFKGKIKVTFPMAADPSGELFNRFSIQNIPQSYLIDRDGKILVKMVGLSPQLLKNMINKVQEALEK